MSRLKSRLSRFREDTGGVVTVEMVITMPLLIWALAATYDFFEIHRHKAVREKATYTVADMFSREQAPVTDSYMDGAHDLFNSMTNDDSPVQIRVTVVVYDEDENQYSVVWSRVRGTGALAALSDAEVRSGGIPLPKMIDGQQIVLVSSLSTYNPAFNVGLENSIRVETSQFMNLRFAPQLCFETTCS
ncbi:TadE/TadG family type IV pilus assembly protein [Roseovarius azorensis]|nr:TadE/TadG family type IV pilus assembly protein [Roseovarius azorensis]